MPLLSVMIEIFSCESSSIRIDGSFFSVARTTPLVAVRARHTQSGYEGDGGGEEFFAHL